MWWAPPKTTTFFDAAPSFEVIIDEARDTGEGLDTKQLGADILYHICLNFVGWSVFISG